MELKNLFRLHIEDGIILYNGICEIGFPLTKDGYIKTTEY